MTDLRPELEELPARLARLPRHRGYPVPWFVEWIQDGQSVPIGQGEPDFRVMSHERFESAVRVGRCWVCGTTLGRHRAFVIGPMCAVNRTSAEPPSHVECGEWSARNCPFLARPHARRRDAGMPVCETVPGIMLERNPGVAGVYRSRTYTTFRPPNGGVLFDMGEPEGVTWWAQGRAATREEVLASIESGLPALRTVAEDESPSAVVALERYVVRAKELLPA